MLIVFLLAVQFCGPDNGDACRWRRMGNFISEQRCHEYGATYLKLEQVRSYKCVMQVAEDRS